MCGIAGWLDWEKDISESDCISAMSESLRRRGPDESGIYVDKNICLIH